LANFLKKRSQFTDSESLKYSRLANFEQIVTKQCRKGNLNTCQKWKFPGNGPPGRAWTPAKFNHDLHKPPEYFHNQQQDHVGPSFDPKSPKETGCNLAPVYYALQLSMLLEYNNLTCLNGAPV
jgi:hypothetical protein